MTCGASDSRRTPSVRAQCKQQAVLSLAGCLAVQRLSRKAAQKHTAAGLSRQQSSVGRTCAASPVGKLRPAPHAVEETCRATRQAGQASLHMTNAGSNELRLPSALCPNLHHPGAYSSAVTTATQAPRKACWRHCCPRVRAKTSAKTNIPSAYVYI